MSAFRTIRTSLATFGVTGGALLLTCAPALAAPETPETTSATGITATSATFNGVLNPNAPSEGGGYRFTYKQSETECEPEGLFQPELPALALGAEKEAVSVAVSGLEPNRPYAFCVIASNLAAEATVGSAEHFTTLGKAPAVEGETAAGVNASAVTLEAQIDPFNEATQYTFEYSTTEAANKLTGTITKVKGEAPLEGRSQTASVPRIEGLSPGTTYYYRVVAENAQSELEGKPAEGTVQSFSTVPAPHTDAVEAGAITATSATLTGTLTPLSLVDTEYFFDFHAGPEGTECVNERSTTQQDAGTGAGVFVVPPTEVAELQPNTAYSVCLVSLNAFGSEVDSSSPPVSFKTLAAPPTVQELKESNVTPYSLTLEAQVNPDSEPTTCEFEYGVTVAANEVKRPCEQGNPVGTLEGGSQPVSVNLTNLQSGTAYYYRVIVKNATGKAEAEAQATTETAKAPEIQLGGEPASAIGSRSVTFNAEINPDFQETSYVFEYATSKEAVEKGEGTQVAGVNVPAVGGFQGVSELATGLLPGREYWFRVLATNQTGTTTGPVVEPPFTTLVVPLVNGMPGDEAEPEATEVTQHSATIAHIAIDPETEEPAEAATYYVLFGETAAYGQALPAPAHASAGYGVTVAEVGSVALYGLNPGTTYHYAIVAHNANGTETSRDFQFTTLPAMPLTTAPVIGASSAQFVNENSAVIEGEVNPEGLQTAYEVQYGTSSAYGSAAPQGQIAPFTSSQGTLTALVGLAPGTAYHYRLVARSQAGTSYGPDETFTTTGAAQTSTFTPFTVPTIAQIAIPPFTFPTERAGGKPAPKRLTNKQKLAAALKACVKKRGAKRAACQRQARKRYGAKAAVRHI
jgi:hypothetical protein